MANMSKHATCLLTVYFSLEKKRQYNSRTLKVKIVKKYTDPQSDHHYE